MKKLLLLIPILFILIFIVTFNWESDVEDEQIEDVEQEQEDDVNEDDVNEEGEDENEVDKVDEAPEESDNTSVEAVEDEVVEDVENEDLSVGDTATFDGVELVLNELRAEVGGKFDIPENDGFLVANLSVENNADEELIVSSPFSFELIDDEGGSHSTMFIQYGLGHTFSAVVEPAGTSSGEIAFDAPESEVYKLIYTPMFGAEKVTWTIPADEIN